MSIMTPEPAIEYAVSYRIPGDDPRIDPVGNVREQAELLAEVRDRWGVDGEPVTRIVTPWQPAVIEVGATVRYVGPRGPRHGIYTVTGPCQCPKFQECVGRFQISTPGGRGLAHVAAAHLVPVGDSL